MVLIRRGAGVQIEYKSGSIGAIFSCYFNDQDTIISEPIERVWRFSIANIFGLMSLSKFGHTCLHNRFILSFSGSLPGILSGAVNEIQYKYKVSNPFLKRWSGC